MRPVKINISPEETIEIRFGFQKNSRSFIVSSSLKAGSKEIDININNFDSELLMTFRTLSNHEIRDVIHWGFDKTYRNENFYYPEDFWDGDLITMWSTKFLVAKVDEWDILCLNLDKNAKNQIFRASLFNKDIYQWISPKLPSREISTFKLSLGERVKNILLQELKTLPNNCLKRKENSGRNLQKGYRR